jgi:multisite-specific tRNA:(cytosine-C5)-methyltransferase
MANPIVKNVIQNNDYTRLRLTSAGTKVFARQGDDFRILGEGVPVILPYIVEEHVITVQGLNVLKTLVSEYYPPLIKFEHGEFRKIAEALGKTSFASCFFPAINETII